MSGWVTRQQSPVLVDRDGDSWAVYLEGSGMTHLVDSVSGEVLCFLAAGVQSREMIQRFVARLLDDSTITIERIEELWLLPLAANGLVEEVL